MKRKSKNILILYFLFIFAAKQKGKEEFEISGGYRRKRNRLF